MSSNETQQSAALGPQYNRPTTEEKEKLEQLWTEGMQSRLNTDRVQRAVTTLGWTARQVKIWITNRRKKLLRDVAKANGKLVPRKKKPSQRYKRGIDMYKAEFMAKHAGTMSKKELMKTAGSSWKLLKREEKKRWSDQAHAINERSPMPSEEDTRRRLIVQADAKLKLLHRKRVPVVAFYPLPNGECELTNTSSLQLFLAGPIGRKFVTDLLQELAKQATGNHPEESTINGEENQDETPEEGSQQEDLTLRNEQRKRTADSPEVDETEGTPEDSEGAPTGPVSKPKSKRRKTEKTNGAARKRSSTTSREPRRSKRSADKSTKGVDSSNETAGNGTAQDTPMPPVLRNHDVNAVADTEVVLNTARTASEQWKRTLALAEKANKQLAKENKRQR